MPIDKRLTDEPLLSVPLQYSDKIHVVLPTDTGQHPTGSSYQATFLQIATLINKNIGSVDLVLTSRRTLTLDYDFLFDGSNNVKIGDNVTPLAKLHVKSTSGTAFRIDGVSLNNILNVSNSGEVSALNGYSINGEPFAKINSLLTTIVGITNAHNQLATLYATTLLGRGAGQNLTTGQGNCFVGTLTGNNTTTGSENICINGGGDNIAGSANVYIGSGGGINSSNNVAVGNRAGAFGVGIGNSSLLTLLGARIGIANAGITASIGLGHETIITASNQFVAGNLAQPINSIYFGGGVYSNSLNQAVPLTNFRSTNVGFVSGTTPHTNGSCVESIIRFTPGISTGTGTSGSLQVMASPSGASGNTPNATFIALEVTAKGGINAPMLGTTRANVPIGGVYLGTDADAITNGDKVLILRMI